MPRSQSALIAFTALALLFSSGCTKKRKELHATMETSLGTVTFKLYENLTPETVENFVGLASGEKSWQSPEDGTEQIDKPFYDGLTFHRVIKDFMIQGGCPVGNGTGDPGYKFEDECYLPGDALTGEIKNADDAQAVFEKVLLPHLQQNNFQSPNEDVDALFVQIREARAFDALVGKNVEDIQAYVDHTTPVTRLKLISPVTYGKLCMANSGPNTNGSQFFVVTKLEGTPWLNGKHTVFGEVIEGMDVVHAIENVNKAPGDRPLEDVIIKSITTAHVKVPIKDKK